jgi:hypothetical protein
LAWFLEETDWVSWQLTNAMESCYAKTVMSGGAGFALGGLFGMFMASVGLSFSLPSLNGGG